MNILIKKTLLTLIFTAFIFQLQAAQSTSFEDEYSKEVFSVCTLKADGIEGFYSLTNEDKADLRRISRSGQTLWKQRTRLPKEKIHLTACALVRSYITMTQFMGLQDFESQCEIQLTRLETLYEGS